MSDPLPLRAGLAALCVLHGLMLASLFVGLPPHPPAAIAPFAMAPFLSAVIACAVAAILLAERRSGQVLAALAGLLALISFGPQKYFDPAFALIWPAVLCAQCAVAAIFGQLAGGMRARRAAKAVPA